MGWVSAMWPLMQPSIWNSPLYVGYLLFHEQSCSTMNFTQVKIWFFQISNSKQPQGSYVAVLCDELQRRLEVHGSIIQHDQHPFQRAGAWPLRLCKYPAHAAHCHDRLASEECVTNLGYLSIDVFFNGFWFMWVFLSGMLDMPGFKGATRSRLLLRERRSQCSMEGNDWFGSNLGAYPRVEQAGGIFSTDDIFGFTSYMASWDREGSLSYM